MKNWYSLHESSMLRDNWSVIPLQVLTSMMMGGWLWHPPGAV